MRVINDLERWKIKSDEAGYVMVMAIFVLVIATLIGVSLAVMGINEYSLSSNARLMDTAYHVAEAGISRACVEIRDDPAIVGTTGGTAHIYKGNEATAFWESGWQTFGTSGWEGKYSARIWQSDVVTNDPTYKVVVSTGKIERSGKTAERTIEVRIIAGASSQDYDACFDYLIYNGFYGKSWASPVVPQNDSGIWPNQTIWLGSFTFDGITPYNGRSPKGVMYTRGSFSMPTGFLSGCTLHGNVVATNDITLANVFGISGMVIDNLGADTLGNYTIPGTDPYNQGNVVAGVDGTGSVNVNMNWNAGVIKVNGYIAAPNDFTIDQSAVIGTVEIGGGIVAGGNAEVTRSVVSTNGGAMKLGSIFCAGDTTINSSWSLGLLTFKQISTGGDCSLLTDGGGNLESDPAAPIAPGDIYCGGKVTLNAAGEWFLITFPGNIDIGNIYAGNPPSDQALDIIINLNGNSAAIQTKNITAQGSVGVTTNSSAAFTSSDIVAGQDSSSNGITVASSGNFTAGNLSAVGSINATIGKATVGSMRSGENIVLTATTTSSAVTSEDLTAVGNITATISGTGAKTLQSMYSGGDLTVDVSGSTASLKNLTAVGAINATITDVPTVGSVWSGGTVTLNPAVRSSTLGDISACTNASITANIKNSSSATGTMTFGRISANGNVTFTGTRSSTSASTYNIDGIKAGGNAGVAVTATNTYCQSLSPWDQGPGTPNSTWPSVDDPLQDPFDPLQDPVNDAVAAGGTYTKSGNVTLYTTAKDALKVTNPDPPPDLSPWIPGVDTPSSPSSPDDPDTPWNATSGGPSAGYPPGTATWFDHKKPNVAQSALLKTAGLEGPVQLLEPNWQYFLDAATQDQATSGKPHVLVDNGPGDADGTVGVIKFLWTYVNYSPNETIYQGDPNVTIRIDINWQGAGSDFKGNLVTQGAVEIINTLDGGGWRFDASQELNLISGRDITKGTTGSGFYWVTADSVRYHWWARGDIKLTDANFALGTDKTFYGSFVAGNRLYYSDAYLWTISKWKWSRWAIDTNAWLPPFTVLSYREI